MASWDYDPIIYKKRSGQIGDEFIEYDNVPYVVKNSRVLLSEIPSERHRVFITGLTETLSKFPESGKFYVDYNNGFIYLNEDINNTTVSISFFGTGIAYFPLSRVYVSETNGVVTETLADFVANIKYLTQDQLDQIGGKVTKTGDTMTGQLSMTNGNGIIFGDKFRIKYNANTNTLDISYFEE